MSSELLTQNVFIDLPDGTSIAATLVRPKGDEPCPVLLSFYPYRKDDFMGASSAYGRQYFAEAGYATLLVDVRGYGNSSGRAYQAWDPREWDDAAVVVEWAARQAWSNGRTGVWGGSYGGGQALGVASRRPASLRAVATIYGAGHSYDDFVYPGGCPNGLGAAAWSALVVAGELAPPSLQDDRGRWLEVWRERLARLDDGDISSLAWPAHTGYDDYWRKRMIPIEEVEVPVFFLAGWRDLLCKGVFDFYERCPSTKRLVAGPWSHSAPELSTECPFDLLLDIRRWFDRWMKDGTAEDGLPNVRYFIQGANEWRSADQWPPAGVEQIKRTVGANGMLGKEHTDVQDEYVGKALVGVEAGLWYPMGLTLNAIFDQSRDDARSLAYTSDPLAAAVDILGAPTARLTIKVADGKAAHACVKLCHVGPDERSTLITSGWAYVAGTTDDQAVQTSLDMPLYPTAYRVPVGHRLRWTISCADFPRLWPTAHTPTITVISNREHPSYICIPVRNPETEARRVFTPDLPPSDVNRAPWVDRMVPVCRITRDEAQQGVTITAGVGIDIRLPQGGSYCLDHSITAQMQANRPAAATMRTHAVLKLELASGELFTVESNGYQTLGRRHLSGSITAGGELVYQRRWSTINGK